MSKCFLLVFHPFLSLSLSSELSTLGLEAWKIGAIAAAVFLVLETVVIIIIYILKCRNKRR